MRSPGPPRCMHQGRIDVCTRAALTRAPGPRRCMHQGRPNAPDWASLMLWHAPPLPPLCSRGLCGRMRAATGSPSGGSLHRLPGLCSRCRCAKKSVAPVRVAACCYTSLWGARAQVDTAVRRRQCAWPHATRHQRCGAHTSDQLHAKPDGSDAAPAGHLL
eukprot:363843-Chlamydomonas_euryale.AAC.8